MRILSELVSTLFNGLPYSKAYNELRRGTEDKLETEYEKLLSEDGNELAAAGKLIARCSTLDDAAKLAGLSPDELQAAQAQPVSHDRKTFRRLFYKVRIFTFFMAAFFAAAFAQILLSVINLGLWYWVGAAIYIALSLPFFLKYRRYCAEFAYDRICLPVKAKEKYDVLCDRYQKRHINFVFVCTGLIIAYSTLFEKSLLANLSHDETIGLANSDIYLIFIGIVLALHSGFTAHFLLSGADEDRRTAFKRYSCKIYILTAAFLITAAGITAIASLFLDNPFIILYICAVIFLGLCIVFNFKSRAALMIQNLRVNKLRAGCFALAGLILFTVSYMKRDIYVLQPYISGVSEVNHREHDINYDNASGQYTITVASDEDFKILHLTDIHLGGSVSSSYKDYKALEACRKLIEYTEPDFIIVTGDMVFPMGVMSFSLNNEAPVREFASFMRNIGIPWAFTYGNHDTESMATGTPETVDRLYQSLSYKSTGSLLYPYTQPDIFGRSNQLITIENENGTVRQALFLLDSNDYVNGMINVYDVIHDDQVDWYADEIARLSDKNGSLVSSMVFFHIPLGEYKTAYDLYMDGDPSVTYHFGKIGETAIDYICCSKFPCKLFDTAVDLGSTQAMFCGHDHYNNISLTYKGIRLCYGLSIDYLVMPGISRDTEQRGGELITIRPDASFDLEQIKLVDIE